VSHIELGVKHVRVRVPASFREILDAMWLFNDKFERALSRFDEIKARQKG